MELDVLKSTWKTILPVDRDSDEISAALAKAQGSVFQRINRHITYDSLGLSLFLICYYTMFDGHKKPLVINLVLVGATLAAILHGIAGYRLIKAPLESKDLLQSFTRQKTRIRNFAAFSVFYKLIFAVSILLFFTFNMAMTPGRWMSTGIIACVFSVQITLLISIWNGRLKRLKEIIRQLTGT